MKPAVIFAYAAGVASGIGVAIFFLRQEGRDPTSHARLPQEAPVVRSSDLSSTPRVTRAETQRNNDPKFGYSLPPHVTEQGGPGKFTSWALQDPEAAADFADSQVDQVRAWLVPDAVAFWAKKGDLRDCAEWLERLDEGSVRSQAAAELSYYWMRRDPTSASEWVAALPKGASRDAAAIQLIRAIRLTDPEAAAEWANTIGDTKLLEQIR